jgi:hypothetical protein
VQYNTYNVFSIVKQHLRILRRYEGIKSVVLFSEGILAERFTPAEHKVQEIIDLAIHSGIVFNSVNYRGVRTYLGRDSFGDIPIMDSSRDADYAQDIGARESTLQQIAHDTGGTYHNNNDMLEGLQKAIKKQSFQYLMSYGMPSDRHPGTYHKIKLETTRPDLQVSCRKGYYIGKEELNVQSSKKEDILSAIYAPGDISEIPVLLSYSYLKEADGSYSASFITKADVKKMQFTKEEDRRKNLVHMVLAAFDENDRYVKGLEKSIEFQLLDDSYSALLNHGITSKVDLKLPPGHYKIKTVVRESNQGKMGSIAKAVDIP